ncbi:MAG: N-acetylneuraminate synthase family protein [Myxococcales bacterium]|nr:N-acetylneuraminate synthase family protein [Myxococcales bacterium]
MQGTPNTLNRPFSIDGRTVGPGHPCYVIAEAGSNHGGSLDTALALIDAAADAGADAVKFQTFQAKRLYAKSAGKSDYLGDERSIFDIIADMEMPESWLPTLAERARSRGLGFLSTPFHEEAVTVLDPFMQAWKVASYELTHHPLLKAIAQTGKPVIMSTGAATTGEIAQAVQVLADAGCAGLVLLQCTAAYPAPLASVNVGALVDLRERFGVPSGLSDHSRDPVVAPATAAALGAVVVEKHFTLSNRLPGPDNAFAVEPHELARLVKRVRDVECALGSGKKATDAGAIDPAEEELRAFARRTLFTTQPIAKGEAFSRDNIDVLRRGKREDGLAPSDLPRVLGTVAAVDLPADAVLSEAHLTAAHAS